MGLFSGIKKALGGVVGGVLKGTLGKIWDAVNIAKTLVVGIAQGKPLGEVLKDVVKQVAVFAIKMAIDHFTAGMGSTVLGKFVDTIANKASGLIGQLAGKVAGDTIAGKLLPKATEFFSKKLFDFAEYAKGDLFKDILTKKMLQVTGLKSAADEIDLTKWNNSDGVNTLAGTLTSSLFDLINIKFKDELDKVPRDLDVPRGSPITFNMSQFD